MNNVNQETAATLLLEDGTIFTGYSCGAGGEAVGEVCFNTSITGYQEIMSDPSYAGQIVVMTYTQIGNVGINPEDMESERPRIRGFVIKESSRISSNWRSRESLSQFLSRHGIPAISGIDTRKLVRILRERGAQRGIIATGAVADPTLLLARARAWPGLEGMDLTGEVTCGAPHSWTESIWQLGSGYLAAPEGAKWKVAVVDCGIKRNILRQLVNIGCELTVFPATVGVEELLRAAPDGVFISNGPGDPAAVGSVIAVIRELARREVPVFGICLGHQMLGLALGGRTIKMKFGHRGGNHPVRNLRTGQVEVTSQNHGFMVEEASLPPEVEVTHRSLFDGSVEGLRHTSLPLFSVQYHPEASPGPHDSHYLFQEFAALLGACK